MMVSGGKQPSPEAGRKEAIAYSEVQLNAKINASRPQTVERVAVVSAPGAAGRLVPTCMLSN